MSAALPVEGSRFAIVGGASLVGSATAELLLARGASEVRILDNFAFAAEDGLAHLRGDPRLRVERCDVRYLPDLQRALEGIDGVLHLAALMTISMHQNPWLGIDVNVRGTQNMLEAARVTGARKVVFASSNAVYGYGPQVAGDLVETTPFHAAGASPASALYGASKILGEQLCRDAVRRHGLRCVTLRYSTVYGERQHGRAANSAFLVEALERIDQGLRPRHVGTATETRHYVYVGDVARANALAFEAPASDVAVNISGPAPAPMLEVLKQLLAAAGSDLEPELVPPPEGGGLLAVGGSFTIDHSRAAEVLGWRPEVDLPEGLRRLVAWHRARSR